MSLILIKQNIVENYRNIIRIEIIATGFFKWFGNRRHVDREKKRLDFWVRISVVLGRGIV
jgi:hypothetical protein